MTRELINCSKPRVLWSLRLLLISCLLLLPQFALPHKAFAATTTASDDFSRADGPLGPNWTDITDGGLAIASQAVTGKAGVVTGDFWTANTFGSDQYSQVALTSAQLSGGLWIGPAVRVQGGGQNAYVGIYYWNNGSPQLELFRRVSGGWGQIGAGYNSRPLGAGAPLQPEALPQPPRRPACRRLP